jgi:hypothetical protein
MLRLKENKRKEKGKKRTEKKKKTLAQSQPLHPFFANCV